MNYRNSIKKKVKEDNLSLYIGGVIGFAISALGLYFINTHLVMNDAFWHIKTGEWVSQAGIINKCYGSWVLAEDSWMAHEWLFGWGIYQISRVGMNNIIRMFDILYLLTILFCFLQAGVWKKNENPPIAYWELVLILQFCIYALEMTARPQYVTAILIACFLFILNKSMQNNYKLLYILPFLTIFWVNIHGGTSLLSYITILVYLLCNIINWDIGKIHFERADKKWIKHCIIALILTVIAIMINPYGYEMLLYPYKNMQDDLMISLIAEWASPDAKNIAVLIFQMIPMLLGFIALIQYQGTIKAHDIALFFLYLVLYLRSARFYPFLVVVQTCLIAPYAFHITFPFNLKKRKKGKTNARMWNNISIILLGCVCIGYMVYVLWDVDYYEIEENKEIPDELLEQVCQDNPERLCNNYNVGGYLLFHDIDVFIDGRYEPYNQKNIIKDFMILMSPSDIGEYHQMGNVIEKYDFDAFLISTGDVELAAYLEKNTDKFSLSYEDENWLYFQSIQKNSKSPILLQ